MNKKENNVNDDWKYYDNLNKKWFTYFDKLFKALKEDSGLAPPAIPKILQDQLRILFSLPESFINKPPQSIKSEAHTETLINLTESILLCFIISLVISKILLLPLINIFLIIILINLFNITYKFKLMGLIENLKNEKCIEINWTDIEKISKISKDDIKF